MLYSPLFLCTFTIFLYFSGEIYKKYFTDFQPNPENWSLADFDLWASTNIVNPQVKNAHQTFYKYLNTVLLLDASTESEIKNARRLVNAKKVNAYC